MIKRAKDQRNVTNFGMVIKETYLEMFPSARAPRNEQQSTIAQRYFGDKGMLMLPLNGLCVCLVPDDWSRTPSR